MIDISHCLNQAKPSQRHRISSITIWHTLGRLGAFGGLGTFRSSRGIGRWFGGGAIGRDTGRRFAGGTDSRDKRFGRGWGRTDILSLGVPATSFLQTR